MRAPGRRRDGIQRAGRRRVTSHDTMVRATAAEVRMRTHRHSDAPAQARSMTGGVRCRPEQSGVVARQDGGSRKMGGGGLFLDLKRGSQKGGRSI